MQIQAVAVSSVNACSYLSVEFGLGWIKGAAYVIISTKRGSSCNRSSGPFGDTTKRHPQALHSDGAKLLEGQLVNEKSSKDQQRLYHWTPREKSAVNSNFPGVRLIARNCGTCNERHH
jgi:hypothetical protein